MQFGDIRDTLNKMISLLKGIERHTRCETCSATVTTSAGANSSIPAGFRSVRVTQTSSTGTVAITMSDATTYTLNAQNEVFEIPIGGVLPAITITAGSGGTWKWVAIK